MCGSSGMFQYCDVTITRGRVPFTPQVWDRLIDWVFIINIRATPNAPGKTSEEGLFKKVTYLLLASHKKVEGIKLTKQNVLTLYYLFSSALYAWYAGQHRQSDAAYSPRSLFTSPTRVKSSFNC
ncbi:hypothetical protein E2C01_045076 [Portunus trituberculatus]|uniref:Uncharacterized protein n=1 Tax=Portunus trituberculatus TaxID=210409 RepID=A0A5B7FXA1_PORTR|nr:hypothetical protein [Portunus trituberculatus]